jgi:hypothetical protein
VVPGVVSRVVVDDWIRDRYPDVQPTTGFREHANTLELHLDDVAVLEIPVVGTSSAPSTSPLRSTQPTTPSTNGVTAAISGSVRVSSSNPRAHTNTVPRTPRSRTSGRGHQGSTAAKARRHPR